MPAFFIGGAQHLTCRGLWQRLSSEHIGSIKQSADAECEDEMDDDFDLEYTPEEKPGLHRRRMIMAALVFGLTSVLVLYSIYLSSRGVDYFINIDGCNSVQKGRPVALRFSAIGVKEQMPLTHLAVRVDLEKDGQAGRTRFKRYSGDEPYAWWVGELPADMSAYPGILPLKNDDFSTYFGRLRRLKNGREALRLLKETDRLLDRAQPADLAAHGPAMPSSPWTTKSMASSRAAGS